MAQSSRITYTEPCFDRFYDCPKISSFSYTLSNAIYEVLDIDKKFDDDIRIIDYTLQNNCQPELILVHYISLKPEISHVRGTIIDVTGEKAVIVCASFPYTPEYDVNKLNAQEKEMVKNILSEKDVSINIATEGTIIRAFCWNNKWYLSTHKKIDAKKSKWQKATFFELFCEVWGENPLEAGNAGYFGKQLNTSKCYIFLLSSPQNRIACQCNENKLYYVCSFSKENDGDRRLNLRGKDEIKYKAVSSPDYITHPVTCLEDVEKIIEGIDYLKYTGLLIMGKAGGVKIFHPNYVNHLRIINGDPSIRNRYLEIRGSRDGEIFRNIIHSDYDWDDLEKMIDDMPKNLAIIYKLRYLQRKNINDLPPAVHHVIKEAYETRDSNIEAKIKNILKTKSTSNLNFIIKYFNGKIGKNHIQSFKEN